MQTPESNLSKLMNILKQNRVIKDENDHYGHPEDRSSVSSITVESERDF